MGERIEGRLERPAIGDLCEVTIEKIVYGGEGLARIGDFAVFVPMAAPGDRLRVRVVSVERRFARAVIEEPIALSPLRRTPPCDYFGTCGGCQLQHLPYADQLDAKVGFVRESLQRIGGIDWQGPLPIHSGPELGYRSRAELKIERDEAGRPRFGYFQLATHELCEVHACPILHPLAGRALERLWEDPSKIPGDATRVWLTLGDGGVLVTAATGENGRIAEIDASGTVSQVVAGKSYSFGVRSFFQGNRLLVDDLVRVACGEEKGARAVDLYAGVGLFSLQLAGRFEKVCAVEGSRVAVAHGTANAQLNAIDNIVFESVSVEGWLKYRTAGWESPDLLLLDPPRAGAGAVVVERIISLAPTTIIYISCDPATLARDLKGLLAGGYRLTSIDAVDMFPQTWHVETVVRLTRSSVV